MRKLCLLLLIAGIVTGGLWFAPAPEAKAIDPVTIAILTPIAIKAAQIAAPYVIKGLKNMGLASLKTLPDFLDLFKLPLGFLMVTVGIPFGVFTKGCSYIFYGFIAPFKLCFHIIMIPVAAFGIQFN